MHRVELREIKRKARVKEKKSGKRVSKKEKREARVKEKKAGSACQRSSRGQHAQNNLKSVKVI